MAEAFAANAVTNHQMKELVRSARSSYDILATTPRRQIWKRRTAASASNGTQTSGRPTRQRPHLLPEMEREGGLEQMEPLLDWVPGASQEVFALQDGPSRPTSVDPPLVRAESAPVEEETGPSEREGQRPKHRFRRPRQHALSLKRLNRRRKQLEMRAARLV